MLCHPIGYRDIDGNPKNIEAKEEKRRLHRKKRRWERKQLEDMASTGMPWLLQICICRTQNEIFFEITVRKSM